MADLMVAGIYMITCRANKKRYVGSAVCLVRRVRNHRHALREGTSTNKRMLRSYQKYGAESFVFEMLEIVDDVQDLLTREQHYLDTLMPEFNTCTIAGSPLGVRHSEVTRRRRGEISRNLWQDEEYRRRMTEGRTYYGHSDATRKKMSETRKRLGSEIIRDPATRAALAEKRRQARLSDWADPEVRARRIEGMRLARERRKAAQP